MGANSAQGWSLFGLLLGFTLLVGGLAALSEGASRMLATLGSVAGIALIVISCAGFYRIKPLEEETEGGKASAQARDVKAKSAI
jgi:hypothetical protein